MKQSYYRVFPIILHVYYSFRLLDTALGESSGASSFSFSRHQWIHIALVFDRTREVVIGYHAGSEIYNRGFTPDNLITTQQMTQMAGWFSDVFTSPRTQALMITSQQDMISSCFTIGLSIKPRFYLLVHSILIHGTSFNQIFA